MLVWKFSFSRHRRPVLEFFKPVREGVDSHAKDLRGFLEYDEIAIPFGDEEPAIEVIETADLRQVEVHGIDFAWIVALLRFYGMPPGNG